MDDRTILKALSNSNLKSVGKSTDIYETRQKFIMNYH